jgi:aminopeptidase YwaD
MKIMINQKMKFVSINFLIALLFCANGLFAQTINPSYATVANMVSQTNVTQYLTDFEGLGVKTRGATALTNTLNYLKAKYTSLGYTVGQMTEHSFINGSFTNKNLIVTKTGTLYPNKYIIVCGHFDSIGGTGTNDNGSGVACILEMARLLVNIPTEYSIKFINFSGEENGLIGSTAYVNNVVNGTNPKMDIRLVLNIDGIGRPSTTTNQIVLCERDEDNTPTTNNAASNVFNNELMAYVGFYSSLTAQRSNISASDYMPFEGNNEVAIGFYQSGPAAPYNHNSSDLLVNMDPVYNYQITKAGVGALLHFAVGTSTVVALPTNTAEPLIVQNVIEPFSIYPNPVNDIVTVKIKANNVFDIKIYSNTGKLVKQEVSTLSTSINIKEFASGNYIFVLTNRRTRQRFTKQIFKE